MELSYNYCSKKITLMTDIRVLFVNRDLFLNTRNNKSLLQGRRFQVQTLAEIIFFDKFFAVFKMLINIIGINLTINFTCNFNSDPVLELLIGCVWRVA